jgi:hypothetical protein
MRCWGKVLVVTAVACLLLTLGCTKKVDPGGTWTGHLDGVNADKHGTSDIEAVLEDTRHGVDGTVKWHNSTGPWGLLEGESLDVRSGKISGKQVSFQAENPLPGGTASANFKGDVEGNTMKGTVDVTIGSVMGGDTYLGNFEITRK